MSQSMKQILSQQMKLTPQQILMSSLLQLPIQALEQRLKQELEQNPLLEEVQDMEEELQQEQNDPQDSTQELESKAEDEKKDDAADDQAAAEEKTKDEKEIDWDQILNDENTFEIRAPRDYSREEDDHEWTQPYRSSLPEHLLDQMRFTPLTEDERQIGEYIIWNINEDGYLTYEDVALPEARTEIEELTEGAREFIESGLTTSAPNGAAVEKQNRKPTTKIDPVAAIATELKTTNVKVLNVLHVIQSFDPPGIGARNLRECLLIQLRQKQKGFYQAMTERSIRIIEEAYEDFLNRRYDKIVRQLKISIEDIKESTKEILECNPKPGDGYFQPEQNYITPDATVRKVNDKFEILVNEYNVPHLRINRAYRQMLLDKGKTSKETKEFIKNKLESAKWLINSLYRRRDTIYRTVEAIVDLQRDFFDKGKEFLKPMKLEDIASRIGVDISTVSRATNGKYVQTDYGVFELKYFFTTAMTTSDGEDVSTRQIKAILKKIVDQENKQKPHSDEMLAKLVSDAGYPIARRTVTKYREQMMIPTARLRKEI
jgi:RNA polymerase sigma-54 factor